MRISILALKGNLTEKSYCCVSFLSGIFDDLLNFDNLYFEWMVNQIYPPGLQLNKANTSDTEVPFLDFHLSISYENL